MSGKKPNLAVYGQSLSDPKQWKRIGSAWTNENKDGKKYISITLDFWPTTNKIGVWPVDEKPEEETDAAV